MNSAPKQDVNPRVSLIAAIDSQGEVYPSFLQTNTNVDIMRLYLSELAKTLDKDSEGWRKNTIFLRDGAKYHTNALTQKHFAFLGMHVIFIGPQSYETSPADLLFAMLKAAQLNPDGLKVGKR